MSIPEAKEKISAITVIADAAILELNRLTAAEAGGTHHLSMSE